MQKAYLMGNEAIGLGALAAGVNFVSGYPGTPSTEVLETIARENRDGRVHVEWSTNEKTGLEAAAGAAYTGARSLVYAAPAAASSPVFSFVEIGRAHV